MFFDPLYFLIMAPALALALWAQHKTQSNFKRFASVGNHAGLTGAEAATRMLQGMGFTVVESSERAKRLPNAVAIEAVQGFLSDHYDPAARTLRLSPQVYGGRSLSAVGVACHEAGHALQHAEGYAALQLRTALVPTASFGSSLAVPLIFIGAILGAGGFILAGILLFTAVVGFQVITLPVEFNASARAKQALAQLGIVRGREEERGVAAVLNAAALTYVAAAVAAIAQLFYFLLLFANQRH